MPRITKNTLKNRLYLTITDWNHADMPTYVRKIESACNALFFGFTCLVVLRKRDAVRQNDLDLLFRTIDLIAAYGAGRLVFVNESRENLPAVWTNMLYVPNFIPVELAPSIKEAEDVLDGITPEAYPIISFRYGESRGNVSLQPSEGHA